jgi:hypothetical protein
MEHIIQSRQDDDLGLEGTGLDTLQVVPSSLGSGAQENLTHQATPNLIGPP